MVIRPDEDQAPAAMRGYFPKDGMMRLDAHFVCAHVCMIYMILSQEIANFLSTPSGFSRFSEFDSLMPDVADALLPFGKRVTNVTNLTKACHD